MAAGLESLARQLKVRVERGDDMNHIRLLAPQQLGERGIGPGLRGDLLDAGAPHLRGIGDRDQPRGRCGPSDGSRMVFRHLAPANQRDPEG
jgi:hypothetical protein